MKQASVASVVESSILISGGVDCKYVQMSRTEGLVEVLNHLENPQWVVVHDHESSKMPPRKKEVPTTSPWDVRCRACALRRGLVASGVHLTGFRVFDGKIQLETLATDGMQQKLLQWLEKTKIGYEVLNTVTSPGNHGRKGLTSRQAETLRLALREGFFEIPRRTDMKTLGELLGCSPASLCEALRRGERAVLGGYMEKHALD